MKTVPAVTRSAVPSPCPHPRTRRLRAVLTVACCLLLVACGSQVPPDQFVNAFGARTDGSSAAAGQTGSAGASAGGGSLSGGTGRAVTGGGANGGGSTGGGAGSSGGTATGGTNGGSGGGGSSGTGPFVGATGLGITAGSCAGFTNSNGITATTIPIANVADLSGPVPGLFRSAQAAVTAYVAYFNSTSSICGRKLKLESLDSQTSESGDQQAATTACGNAFAMVGSFGAFDAGGASTVSNCGIPDIRAGTTETTREKCPVCYGVYSLKVSEVPAQPFAYFKTLPGAPYKKAAFVYLNVGAASINGNSFIAAESKLGYQFKDKIAIDITSVPNYNGYAIQLKGDGIKYVQYTGAYQYMAKLQAAFAQNNYHPVVVYDPTAYDAGFVGNGSSVNGTYVFIAGPLFDEASRNPQLSAYLTWLGRTSGGAPSFFGTYAWSAASLFTQLAVELGGKLSRTTLLAALRNVGKYTDFGMTPPQNVGSKQTPNCTSVIQLESGKWVRRTPYPYTCGAVIDSGVGN